MNKSRRERSVCNCLIVGPAVFHPADYTHYVLPWMKQIIAGIAPHVPVINFATGNPELLPLLRGDSPHRRRC